MQTFRNVLFVMMLMIPVLAGCTSSDSENATAAESGATSPYTEISDRKIKALSEEKINALLQGEGSGYALSAELNHYPGPSHVLELASDLSLSKEQKQKIQEIYDVMNAKARRIGEQIVKLETELDQAFRDHTISEQELDRLAGKISSLDGQLRSTHLKAHIETRSLLNDRQIEQYDVLRGYSPNTDDREHDGHSH